VDCEVNEGMVLIAHPNTYTAEFRYEQRVSESHVAGQRQISIRVGNQDHTFIHLAIDIFEHPRILVRVQPEIMPAHTRVPGSRVLAIALAAEDVVLNTRDVFDVDARLDEVLGGGLS